MQGRQDRFQPRRGPNAPERDRATATLPMISSPLRGVALVLGAAALWGTTGTAQSLAPPALPSAWVGALRLVVAGVFFGAYRGPQ